MKIETRYAQETRRLLWIEIAVENTLFLDRVLPEARNGNEEADEEGDENTVQLHATPGPHYTDREAPVSSISGDPDRPI